MECRYCCSDAHRGSSLFQFGPYNPTKLGETLSVVSSIPLQINEIGNWREVCKTCHLVMARLGFGSVFAIGESNWLFVRTYGYEITYERVIYEQ
jgi:hypothetical protein